MYVSVYLFVQTVTNPSDRGGFGKQTILSDNTVLFLAEMDPSSGLVATCDRFKKSPLKYCCQAGNNTNAK